MSTDRPDHPYDGNFLHEALQYVAAKTNNAKCPFCGNTNWTYENEGGVLVPVPKVAYVPMSNRAFFGPAPAIPVITLTCTECGFVRHHNLPMVKTRIDGSNG